MAERYMDIWRYGRLITLRHFPSYGFIARFSIDCLLSCSIFALHFFQIYHNINVLPNPILVQLVCVQMKGEIADKDNLFHFSLFIKSSSRGSDSVGHGCCGKLE